MNDLRFNDQLHRRTDSATENLNKHEDLMYLLQPLSKITEMNEEETPTEMSQSKAATSLVRRTSRIFRSLASCLFWCAGLCKVDPDIWDDVDLDKEIRRLRSLIVKPFIPPIKSSKKMLVLDFDSTLVLRCEPTDNWDFCIKVNTKLTQDLYRESPQLYFKKRFGVEYFLSEMNLYYDIVVFSREEENLTKEVIRRINPASTVQHMLSRQHCTKLNRCYAKNLNTLGRKLKDVVLLEVSKALIQSDPSSAMIHPDNFVELTAFDGNSRDRELIKIIPFLKYLSEV